MKKPGKRGWLLLAAVLAVLVTVWLWTLGRPAKPPSGRHPILVLGIDGGEWRVIRELWKQGKLRHLKAISERGTTASLRTAYNSSPVIWTTIATGVTPPVHGITDFVVPTPKGDVPISSSVRRVPALWNMLSRVDRRVSVLGWWGSWPAEEINGVVVTDRALLDLPDRVSPPSYLPQFLEDLKEAESDPGLFRVAEEPDRRDLAVARTAARLAGERFDLLLVYFRSPDMTSHNYWKYFDPEAFGNIDPVELARNRSRVPQSYEAVDEEIGRILAAAPKETNVVVLSDHGFHAARPEEVKVLLDLDTVLEKLGYLKRSADGIDFSRSRFYSYGSASYRRGKLVRFSLAGREPGGPVRPEDRAVLQRALAAALATVTYESGAPVFHVRDARPREIEEGADFVIGVSPAKATQALRIRGKRFDGAIESISRISGTHTLNTHGIFLAAGPDIDPTARLAGIGIHDIAPTLLYGLGLPVAEDFAGKPRMDLFTPEFRERHSLRTIRSWGKRSGESRPSPSKVDEELVDELRSLGYVN